MAAGDCLSHPNLELLARLERIDALDRRGAPPAELLPELRGLLRDAEGWSRPGAAGEARPGVDRKSGEEVVERLRTAPHET
jgi:hypothetical protein